jgi:hypothetical protein
MERTGNGDVDDLGHVRAAIVPKGVRSRNLNFRVCAGRRTGLFVQSARHFTGSAKFGIEFNRWPHDEYAAKPLVQSTPWANIASATLTKPAMLAPST